MNEAVRLKLRKRKRELEENMNLDVGPPLTKKVFKKKYQEVETRESYEGTYEEEFWSNWPRKELPERGEHWLDREGIETLARELNYDSHLLRQVLSWFDRGAPLGVKKAEARMPTRGKNSKSSYLYGDRMTDAVRDWVESGIAAGPFTKKEVELMVEKGMPEIKVTPLSVAIKDNGKARICMNLSFPHLAKDEEVKQGEACSVNRGIDVSEFPAKMASSRDIVERLFELGWSACFSKIDWTSGEGPSIVVLLLSFYVLQHISILVWCLMITISSSLNGVVDCSVSSGSLLAVQVLLDCLTWHRT